MGVGDSLYARLSLGDSLYARLSLSSLAPFALPGATATMQKTLQCFLCSCQPGPTSHFRGEVQRPSESEADNGAEAAVMTWDDGLSLALLGQVCHVHLWIAKGSGFILLFPFSNSSFVVKCQNTCPYLCFASMCRGSNGTLNDRAGANQSQQKTRQKV